MDSENPIEEDLGIITGFLFSFSLVIFALISAFLILAYQFSSNIKRTIPILNFYEEYFIPICFGLSTLNAIYVCSCDKQFSLRTNIRFFWALVMFLYFVSCLTYQYLVKISRAIINRIAMCFKNKDKQEE